MFYPFVNALRTLGVSMLARHGLELDLQTMPPLPESAENVTNYVGLLSRDEDGVLYAGRGHCNPLGLAAGTTALAGSVMLPSLSRAREITKRAVSAANLRGMGQACHVYASDHADQFPESFDVLLQAGLVTPVQLRSPRAEDQDTVSYIYVTGQTGESDPRNVLAYERPVGSEGTNVLFVDGHVEWMKIGAFQAAVRETYRRLGREDQIPAELRPGPGPDD
jgi:prepilin-type processing-associated H-X9-DG protein